MWQTAQNYGQEDLVRKLCITHSEHSHAILVKHFSCLKCSVRSEGRGHQMSGAELMIKESKYSSRKKWKTY